MIDRFIELLTGLVKDKPWWPFIRPAIAFLTLYAMAAVIAYQYVEWRYHFTPELTTFLRSYVVKEITVVFAAVAALVSLFTVRWKSALPTHAAARVREWVRSGTWSLVIASAVIVIATAAFLRFVPHKVSQITVKFLDEPTSFNPYALAYIVYELNRFQNDWHFTLDADPFNENSRPTATADDCASDSLCLALHDAQVSAHDALLIGITEKVFEQDSFWENTGTVSVISAADLKSYEPPSVYESLTYALIVQSTLIHLNSSCGGAPQDAYAPSRASYGDLFEFFPRRNQIKAAVLAAHLSEKGQELLANCFGLEYMNICNQLLSLDWLRSGRVHDNLDKTFHVTL